MRPLATAGVISALLVVGVFAPVRLHAEDLILDEVKAGHRAARQAIRTFSASVTVALELPDKATLASGRYWRVGETVRIQLGKEGAWTSDYLVKGGEIRQVTRSKWAGSRPQFHEANRRPATDFLTLSDVWREMMIDLVGPEGGQMSYDRLLEVSRPDAATSRQRKEGREFAKVSRAYSNSRGQETRIVLWHDIRCNYLIRKLEASYPGTKASGVVTVTEFAEPHPGVFVPLRCKRESYQNGSLSQVRVTSLTDVRVNEPIPPASLSLPSIPSGTILDDTIDGTSGKVGADWRPIGPREESFGRQPVPPSSSAGGSVWDAPSSSEPASPWWWVVALSSGVLALSLGYMVVRRLRGARAEAA